MYVDVIQFYCSPIKKSNIKKKSDAICAALATTLAFCLFVKENWTEIVEMMMARPYRRRAKLHEHNIPAFCGAAADQHTPYGIIVVIISRSIVPNTGHPWVLCVFSFFVAISNKTVNPWQIHTVTEHMRRARLSLGSVSWITPRYWGLNCLTFRAKIS